MCELFGYYGATRRDIADELREFYSHSERHPDGWGIALLDADPIDAEREPTCASESPALARRLSQPVESSILLAHIRKATVGANEPLNCHPFCGDDCSGRHWSLIHNGTVFSYPPMEKFADVQVGTCDSERVLLHILELMDDAIARKGAPLDASERFEILDAMLCDASGPNKLNMLLYDGELLFAHVNYADTLHIRLTDDGVMFSTQPLSLGQWEDAPFTQLVAYERNERKFLGTCHGGQYFSKAERERLAALEEGRSE